MPRFDGTDADESSNNAVFGLDLLPAETVQTVVHGGSVHGNPFGRLVDLYAEKTTWGFLCFFSFYAVFDVPRSDDTMQQNGLKRVKRVFAR